MAIDVMEEIIMYEEKAKKIKEDAKAFANQIYEEIIAAAKADATAEEKEYKERLAKEHEELKSRHITMLNDYENEAKTDGDTLYNNLCKHKTSLAQSLVRYILDKE